MKYLKHIWLNGTKLNSLTFDFEYLGSKLSDIANVLINKEMVMWYLLYTITVHKELMDTHTLTLSDLSWEKGFCAGSWSIPPPILKPRIRLSPCRNFWISIRSCSTEEEKKQNQPHLHRALHRQLKNRDTQNEFNICFFQGFFPCSKKKFFKEMCHSGCGHGNYN